jgi:hypothetical protein
MWNGVKNIIKHLILHSNHQSRVHGTIPQTIDAHRDPPILICGRRNRFKDSSAIASRAK